MLASYDVVVIGAGVVGAAIAAELSRTRLSVLWLEQAHDVAEGASKANSGITATGFDVPPGTLESRLLREASPRWERVCEDLGVAFRRVGGLTLAFGDNDLPGLDELAEQAARADVPAEILEGTRLRDLAAGMAPTAIRALHVPGEGIIDPIGLTVAWATLAVRNGVDLRLGTPALGFDRDSAGRLTAVRTPGGLFGVGGAVVNAAGLGADVVSAAAGDTLSHNWPRKGEFLLVDPARATGVTKILGTVPDEVTRGVLAIPTVGRGLLLGPTATDGDDRTDTSTDEPTLSWVMRQAQRLVPGISRGDVIKAWAGLRPASDRSYRVEPSPSVPNLVHANGIRSTGVSSSPAVAALVRTVLDRMGLPVEPRAGAVTRLSRPRRLAALDDGQAVELASVDPGLATVVCACEQVSAAEIRAACRGPVPATSLDGVRKRTRATAGRCQGACCAVGVRLLLADERGLTPGEVPKNEPGSGWDSAGEPLPAARRPAPGTTGAGVLAPSPAGRPMVAVAGSGLAGLACAVALADDCEVTLLERLPMPGGEQCDDARHAGLAARAEKAGVRLVAGTHALRWDGDRVLALGRSCGLFPARALVVATGHRPLTRAELGVEGTRSAGVVTVAEARGLLACGMRLGRAPVVYGHGDQARAVIETLLASGTERPMLVTPSSAVPALPDGVEVVASARLRATAGQPRVTGVEIEQRGVRRWRSCDALVLAVGAVPYRAIDGAVLPRDGVVFAQAEARPLASGDPSPGTHWDPVAGGAAAAARVLAMVQHR